MIYDFFNIGKLIDSDGVHCLDPFCLKLWLKVRFFRYKIGDHNQ